MTSISIDIKGLSTPPTRWRYFAMATVFTFIMLSSSFMINSAYAQSLAQGFGGLSKGNKEPISIEADSLEVLDDEKYAIFIGNVNVRQGKLHLVSKKLKVTYTGGDGVKGKKAETRGIKFIDATGKVAITTPDNQSATSDWAKFNVLTKIVTIGGHVVLSQAGNVMRGNKLIIDLNTGRSKLYSSSTPTDGKKGKRQRIRGIFLPGKMNGKNPFGSSSKKKKTAKKVDKKQTKSTKKPPLPWNDSAFNTGN